MGSWVFQPQPGPEGSDGKSAYEIAKENGFPGTEQEWLDSLVGADGPPSTEPGPDGADGKSAYEIAVENGFPGTEQEWLDSLKGEPGDDGIIAATPYEQIEPVGPTLELSDSTFGHLLPNTAHFDQIEMFPVGMIISWVGDYGQVPNGWLLCHGQNLTGYETDLLRLYQIMPDYHGVGFFHTPDFRGRSPMGIGSGTGFSPIDDPSIANMTRAIALGQRAGDWKLQMHYHFTGNPGEAGGWPAWQAIGFGASSGQTFTATNSGSGSSSEPGKMTGGNEGNTHPVTGVNFLIYCGQDTLAIKDRDDLGNVDAVTTRAMIEARLAEKGISEEQVKMLKEQLEELKRTEAK